MIASLHDKDKKVNIPGFYDKVIEISKAQRQKMNINATPEEEFQKSIAIKASVGEKGYTTLERKSIRPTLDVNGIWGGYIGEGAKTVIPSKAHAKISMRLVPNQNWEEISELFNKHFRSIAPEGVDVQVKTHHGTTSKEDQSLRRPKKITNNGLKRDKLINQFDGLNNLGELNFIDVRDAERKLNY